MNGVEARIYEAFVFFTIMAEDYRKISIEDAISEICSKPLPEFVINKIMGNSRIPTEMRSETIFFKTLLDIVNAGDVEYKFILQHKILKYKVDCFFEESSLFGKKSACIIEFDESFHDLVPNMIDDEIRMQEITNHLLKKYKQITVFRVKEKFKNECLKHLIPYLSKFDCHCLDVAIDKKYIDVSYHGEL